MTCVRFWVGRRCYVITVVMNVELGWAKLDWMWNLLAWWSDCPCEENFLSLGWITCFIHLNARNSSSLFSFLYILECSSSEIRVSSFKLPPNRSRRHKLYPRCHLEGCAEMLPVRETWTGTRWWTSMRISKENSLAKRHKQKVVQAILTKAYWDTVARWHETADMWTSFLWLLQHSHPIPMPPN